MHRPIFNEGHAAFDRVVNGFYGDEVLPEYPEWERAGQPPRHFWKRAGELGLLAIGMPPKFGGTASQDFRYNVVLTEASQRFGLALGGLRVQTDIALPYLLEYGTAEQQAAWLPRMVSGEVIVALAISEAGAGSDIKSMSTRADRDGDDYVVNGSKTFISNGAAADLVLLVVKTRPDAGRDGLSILLVDATTPGFARGRKLDKIGLTAQDLAELFFTDMRVPVANLLGEENRGFEYLTSNLAQERLSIAVNSQASAAAVLAESAGHFARDRSPGNSQHVKFELASCAALVAAGQALIDQAIVAHTRSTLSATDAATVKLFCTEMQGSVVDRCLRLRGLTGYQRQSLLGRAYLDSRVSRIYGGSSEIMKVIIAKELGL